LAVHQKINMSDFWVAHCFAAMTHAQLGNRAAAQAEVERTLRLWPKFEQIFGMKHLGKWFRNQPDLIAHILEGVKLAGFRTRSETVEGVRSGGVVEWWKWWSKRQTYMLAGSAGCPEPSAQVDAMVLSGCRICGNLTYE
jgi:hypothetical protein